MKDRLEIFWSRYTVMLYHLAESLGGGGCIWKYDCS